MNSTTANVTKKVISRSHTSTNPPTVLRNTHKNKDDSIKKFIPSPELIVDASQSSESSEKFIIKNHHQFIPVSHLFFCNLFFNNLFISNVWSSPTDDYALNRIYYWHIFIIFIICMSFGYNSIIRFRVSVFGATVTFWTLITNGQHSNYFHDNSRSIIATNHSHEQDYAIYGVSTTTAEPYAAVHYETAINENEKLPWPYQYENEFKWKTVKPTLPFNIYHVRTKSPYHTIQLNPTIKSIPFSPIISHSVDSTITSPTSIHHPYVFENVAPDLSVNQANPTTTYGSDNLPTNQQNSFNLYAQPIDNMSYGPREQSNPVDLIDKR